MGWWLDSAGPHRRMTSSSPPLAGAPAQNLRWSPVNQDNQDTSLRKRFLSKPKHLKTKYLLYSKSGQQLPLQLRSNQRGPLWKGKWSAAGSQRAKPPFGWEKTPGWAPIPKSWWMSPPKKYCSWWIGFIPWNHQIWSSLRMFSDRCRMQLRSLWEWKLHWGRLAMPSSCQTPWVNVTNWWIEKKNKTLLPWWTPNWSMNRYSSPPTQMFSTTRHSALFRTCPGTLKELSGLAGSFFFPKLRSSHCDVHRVSVLSPTPSPALVMSCRPFSQCPPAMAWNASKPWMAKALASTWWCRLFGSFKGSNVHKLPFEKGEHDCCTPWFLYLKQSQGPPHP